MKLIPFKAIYPNQSLIASPDSFFDSVKTQFTEYKQNGFFKTVDQDSIFIYQLSTRGEVKHGIISCADIKDFNEGKVLKHENTIAAKEQKMMQLMLQHRAMVKPVLIAYDKVEEIDSFINNIIKNQPKFLSIEFENTVESHTLWQVTDSKELKQIKKLFSDYVPKSYIADGHHRVKTCQLLNETNTKNAELDTSLKSVLSLFFSWDQLSIYEYNRCIDAFQNYSPIHFMAELSKVCSIQRIKSPKKPKAKHELTMCLYGEWYRLKWKKSILKKHANKDVLFDTYLLNKYILNDILDITNVREDQRLRYIDGVVGTDSLQELVNENENRVGFCLYPIAKEDVKTIAEHNGTLPPKSTWFEPRIKNGIIVKGF